MADTWERQADEPPEWFARFRIYRDLGPDRSMEAAWRLWNEARPATERSNAKRAPSGWVGRSKRHDWRERAAAWDVDRRRRAELRAVEQSRTAEKAQDQFIDDELAARRHRVTQLGELASRMLEQVLEIEAFTPATLRQVDVTLRVVALAMSESRRECIVTEELLQRLVDVFRHHPAALAAVGG